MSGRLLGDRVISPERGVALEQNLLVELASWHRAHPLAHGAPRRDLRRGPLGHLSERAFDALIADLQAAERVVAEGPRIRTPEHSVSLSPAQQAALDALDHRLAAASFEGLAFDETVSAAPELLQLLLDAGRAERVTDRILHRDALTELVDRVRAHLVAHETLQPGDFKTLTGLSRRTAIPLLEWLDARRVTVRMGDLRRLRTP